jgi:hypothetical protein
MIAIGGVGGSGTRVVATLLEHMGFYLGGDLNEPQDNLWFTLLFKREEIFEAHDREFAMLVGIFSDAMHSVPVASPERAALVRSLAARGRGGRLTPDWLQQRAESLLLAGHGISAQLVAWKEPNTHIVLDRLVTHMPGLRYIHVMRNGLDMAFSSNQKQTLLWGPRITGKPFEPSARYSLHYWRKAHERVFQIGRQMGESFRLINFDELCQSPSESIGNLAAFAGIKLSDELQETFCAEVRRPTSIGRFREHDQAALDREDIDFVAACGFPTT